MPKKKYMAVGGFAGGKPGESAMARAEATRSTPSRTSSPRDGGFAGAGRSAGGGGSGGGRSAAVRSRPAGGPPFDPPKVRGAQEKSSGTYPSVNRSGKGNPQGSVSGKDPARLKKGGMVKKKKGK